MLFNIKLLCQVKHWERSTDSGQLNEYGEQGRILSTGRTSSNAWCDAECESVRVEMIILHVTYINSVTYINRKSIFFPINFRLT